MPDALFPPLNLMYQNHIFVFCFCFLPMPPMSSPLIVMKWSRVQSYLFRLYNALFFFTSSVLCTFGMLGIMFGLAMRQEISIASNPDNVKVISDISNCLIPVYHPRHVSELEKTLSLLKIKKAR